MDIVALILAIAALLVALAAWSRAGGDARADEVDLQARRRVENLGEEMREQLDNLRQLLAQSVTGTPLTADMVLEGRLWSETDGAAAKALVEGGARVIDVRTAAEVQTGKIPGALCIPIEQLEERLEEVPAVEGTTLIYCAGGARSAAACEILSQLGQRGLHNLEGGIGTWPGELERG